MGCNLVSDCSICDFDFCDGNSEFREARRRAEAEELFWSFPAEDIDSKDQDDCNDWWTWDNRHALEHDYYSDWHDGYEVGISYFPNEFRPEVADEMRKSWAESIGQDVKISEVATGITLPVGFCAEPIRITLGGNDNSTRLITVVIWNVTQKEAVSIAGNIQNNPCIRVSGKLYLDASGLCIDVTDREQIEAREGSVFWAIDDSNESQCEQSSDAF